MLFTFDGANNKSTSFRANTNAEAQAACEKMIADGWYPIWEKTTIRGRGAARLVAKAKNRPVRKTMGVLWKGAPTGVSVPKDGATSTTTDKTTKQKDSTVTTKTTATKTRQTKNDKMLANLTGERVIVKFKTDETQIGLLAVNPTKATEFRVGAFGQWFKGSDITSVLSGTASSTDKVEDEKKATEEVAPVKAAAKKTAQKKTATTSDKFKVDGVGRAMSKDKAREQAEGKARSIMKRGWSARWYGNTYRVVNARGTVQETFSLKKA